MPMPASEPECVANEVQYRAVRARIATLDRHLQAIADLRDMARAHRKAQIIEDEDLRDLAPLEDAASDIAWTRDGLRRAAGAWDDHITYGKHPAELAPVITSFSGKG